MKIESEIIFSHRGVKICEISCGVPLQKTEEVRRGEAAGHRGLLFAAPQDPRHHSDHGMEATSQTLLRAREKHDTQRPARDQVEGWLTPIPALIWYVPAFALIGRQLF